MSGSANIGKNTILEVNVDWTPIIGDTGLTLWLTRNMSYFYTSYSYQALSWEILSLASIPGKWSWSDAL